MKLLAVTSAKAIWLVPSVFLNPRGLTVWPMFLAAKERYQFQKIPTELPLNTADGWKFEGGAFKGPDEFPVIVHLTIHIDGLIAETKSSTAHGDMFLEDLLDWASKEHGLASHRTLLVQRIYSSEVFVELENPPKLLNTGLDPLLNEATKYMSDQRRGPLDFSSMTFSSDPGLSDRPITFRIERQAAAPFSQNHYYSFAPTETDKHLRLLEQLENLG